MSFIWENMVKKLKTKFYMGKYGLKKLKTTTNEHL